MTPGSSTPSVDDAMLTTSAYVKAHLTGDDRTANAIVNSVGAETLLLCATGTAAGQHDARGPFLVSRPRH